MAPYLWDDATDANSVANELGNLAALELASEREVLRLAQVFRGTFEGSHHDRLALRPPRRRFSLGRSAALARQLEGLSNEPEDRLHRRFVVAHRHGLRPTRRRRGWEATGFWQDELSTTFGGPASIGLSSEPGGAPRSGTLNRACAVRPLEAVSMERPSSAAVGYSLVYFVATALAIWMLLSDQNLRTDFGTLSNGYYAHWYAVLAMAIVSGVGGVLLATVRTRWAILAGTIGAALLALAMVGDIFTYAQVGFSSAWDFAQYLFGITYYGGDVRYLYDALLAVYVVAAIVGAVLFAVTRPGPTTESSSAGR